MSVPSNDLAQLFPLDSLRPETRMQVSREAHALDLSRGDRVFSVGDVDEDTIYLLEGELRCEYPDGRVVRHLAQSGHARHALNDATPRRFNASVASHKAQIIKINRRLLEKLITWDQISRDEKAGHFTATPNGNVWAYRLLQSQAFLKLPTGNLEKMFRAFEERKVTHGEIIMREGDPADFFYVIREGTASVSKNLDGAPQVVAYLSEGDAFGEDALLSNEPRNATVRMMQGGRLMRLSKADFETVLKPPMVSWILPADAARMVQAGTKIIDVRMPEEFGERQISGAHNVPMYRLREDAMDHLKKGDQVIVYCNTGERSAAAAFILHRLGFQVSALHGGLSAMLRMIAQKEAAALAAAEAESS